MRMPFAVASLLLSVAGFARADGLADARKLWLRGNYEEARAKYEVLAKDAKSAVPAAIGVAQTWRSQGEYDKALGALDEGLRGAAANADLLAQRADLLHFLGRWEEAEPIAQQVLSTTPDHFLARWVRAALWRDRGEVKKAEAEFRWFVRTYSDRSDKDNDIKDPDTLLIVAFAGAENARWNGLADQFPFILNEVYADALRYDPDLWQAEVQAGMLLLEKYNRGEALSAFDKALAINARAAEAMVGKGMAALMKLEIKEAEEFAGRALRANPNLPDARRLRADVYLATGDHKAALRELERARQINPRDENTLGRLAVCLHLQKKQKELDALTREIEQHDPKPGVFYLVLAEGLEARRHYDDAERLYRKAMALRPMLPEPQNGLGLLYMRLGREAEAKDVLTRAFEADAYNVRVSNMLKVLRHLEHYETLQTPHFELRFDPKNDRHLARYMARFLEEVHADLSAKFGYQPPGKILVEVFNNHEMFSGRTVALPDLHTIGACTGRMFAMVSPRGKGIGKPFNWARVLRHELVHIFNLEQSKFLVPHWYTEGLAVVNEGFPRPQHWNQILLERVPKWDMLNLDDIDLGFIKPRSPEEWHLAYCQSQLYVEYLKTKHGPAAVGGLLDAFRDGLDTARALQKVCKTDKVTFEQGYRAFVEDQVKQLKGKPAEKTLTFAQLQRAQAEKPDDADLSAKLAEQMLLRKRNADAKRLAESALSKVPTQPLASYVKSRLLLAAGDETEARKLLEAALDRQDPDDKVLAALGKMAYESNDFNKAAEIYELAHKGQPYESKWLVELARVYAQMGDRTRQIGALKKLVPNDADDLDLRKRVAKMLLEATQPAEAEKYARQALEIDVVDVAAQTMLADALLGQNKKEEAIETYRVVLEMDDKLDAVRLKLAKALVQVGKRKEASDEAAKVLMHDPENEEAKQLLEKPRK